MGIERYAEKLRAVSSDPLLGPPTISVGRIEGGTSVNTVPDRCQIEIDRRVVGGEDAGAAPEHLLHFLRTDAGIDFPLESMPPWMNKAPLTPALSGPLRERLGRAIDAVKGTHQVHAVPYGTDASTIAAAGIPAVVFGPGDIAQAHTIDEWVSLDEVEQASEILYRLVCSG
jgi:acetylornithine deacetylase